MGTNAAGQPGCAVTGIQQRFDCFEANNGDFCTVTFQANYPAGAVNEIPEVQLSNGLGSSTKGIPVAPGWVTYTISIPFCSRMCDISFALFGPETGTATTLRIDNVTNECTSTDETSDDLVFANDPGRLLANGSLEDHTPAVPALSVPGAVLLALLILGSAVYLLRRRTIA